MRGSEIAAHGAGTARANRRRGEVEAVIDGERRILCLTLGALAELETAFSVGDLGGLGERFSSGRLKAADMIRILGAGLRGGGNLFSDDEVAAMSVEGGLAAYARITADLLTATFAGPEGVSEGAVAANP
ncbi:gene transfer agent family protein [Neorhizobium alkalisoli]|uniref:Tail tube GTA-gp10-like protein n=1 Tax=Neorhizobium alkalisoli TaxID=528178 RepID=A0A561R307_9HYPH|nr:gene transfer agent family protein [Neorhizobium alkalisoli]TWF57000.1 tail tube GTA-gp10-like protein [Neorhizobium alkalisoli]